MLASDRSSLFSVGAECSVGLEPELAVDHRLAVDRRQAVDRRLVADRRLVVAEDIVVVPWYSCVAFEVKPYLGCIPLVIRHLVLRIPRILAWAVG